MAQAVTAVVADKLLSRHFALGRQKLGGGAFGVVFTCTRRSSGEELAVKMVDTLENKAGDVLKEAQMLQNLDHPSIVRFHGLFTHSEYLCIVMEKLSGGDLVEGLQRHLRQRGNIRGETIVAAVRQMGSSIQYLHRRMVVHRDVKGDNFLLDRADIADPACRLVLTDFGASCRVERGTRMADVVGTRKFSPPEFFDRNYGEKVDIWALGVVLYGLATGRFPFRDERDVRSKQICVPSTVHPPFADLITQMLQKDEASRLDSDQVMRHEYMHSGSESLAKAAFVSMSDAVVAQGEHSPAGVTRADTPRTSRAWRAGIWGKSSAGRMASTREPSTGSLDARQTFRLAFRLATAKLQAALEASPASSSRATTGGSAEAGPPAPRAAEWRGRSAAGAPPSTAQDWLSALQVQAAGCLPACLQGLGSLREAPRRGSVANELRRAPGAGGERRGPRKGVAATAAAARSRPGPRGAIGQVATR